MVPHWIFERKQWIENLFNRSFQLAEQKSVKKDAEFFFLPLGIDEGKEIGLLLDIPLSPREKAFLLRLSEEWKRAHEWNRFQSKEKQLMDWILSSLERPTPLPEHLPIDWKIARVPLMLSSLQQKNCQKEISLLKEVLVSYLPKETLYLLYNSCTLLCLVPSEAIEEEGSGEEALFEWVSGLYDACQNELPFPFDLLYHLPYRNPGELIERVRDLHHALQACLWMQPIRRPVAPWQLLLEQMVSGLSEEDRKRVLHLLEHQGSLSLLEQKEWVQTLEIFFRSNLNVSLAAKELFIHRNTLLYRLDRITEETGLDPRSFQDALYLKLALMLLQADRYYTQKLQENR